MIDDIILFDIFASSTASIVNATFFPSHMLLNHFSIKSSAALQCEAFCDAPLLEYTLTSFLGIIVKK